MYKKSCRGLARVWEGLIKLIVERDKENMTDNRTEFKNTCIKAMTKCWDLRFLENINIGAKIQNDTNIITLGINNSNDSCWGIKCSDFYGNDE